MSTFDRKEPLSDAEHDLLAIAEFLAPQIYRAPVQMSDAQLVKSRQHELHHVDGLWRLRWIDRHKTETT